MPSGSVRLTGVRLDVSHLAAIVQMEVVKIFKDPTEMLSRSFQPVLWLLIFGGAMNRARIIPTGTVSYLAFLTPGVLAQSIMFVSIFNGLSIIWERDMGILQRMLSTPIRRSVLVLMVLGSAFFSGLSMTIASIVRTRERMMGIGQLVTMPLFFASNAIYPIEIMPGWLKVLSAANPLTYLVSGLRNLLLSPEVSGIGLDIAVLGLAMLVVLSIATRLYPRLLH